MSSQENLPCNSWYFRSTGGSLHAWEPVVVDRRMVALLQTCASKHQRRSSIANHQLAFRRPDRGAVNVDLITMWLSARGTVACLFVNSLRTQRPVGPRRSQPGAVDAAILRGLGDVRCWQDMLHMYSTLFHRSPTCSARMCRQLSTTTIHQAIWAAHGSLEGGGLDRTAQRKTTPVSTYRMHPHHGHW